MYLNSLLKFVKYRWRDVFYFTYISLTSNSNHVRNNSCHFTCKHLNLHNSIISTFLSYLHLILHQRGNIESNLGPDKTKLKNFSWCHWNVNSLVAHNFQNSVNLKHISWVLHYAQQWKHTARWVLFGQIRSS